MAGKVHHWKHGWIPLDAYARAQVAARKAPDSKKPGAIEPGGVSFIQQQHYGKVVDPIGDREKKTGISWIDNTEDDFLHDYDTPGHRRTVAKAIHEFQEQFPRLPGPVPAEIVSMVQMRYDEDAGEAWGITSLAPPHEVKLNQSMWDDYDVREKLERMDLGEVPGGRHGYAMVAAQVAKTPAQFRRMVVLHELGHYMHVKNQEKYGAILPDMVGSSTAFGPMDELANEKVTPRQMGFTNGDGIDNKYPRWAADSLDWRSQYAMGQNQYEWWAEALLDGLVNGPNASESGKRALEIAKKEYG